MKSFFVIKGNPDKWFDQKGNSIAIFHGLPYVKAAILEDPIGAEFSINDPDTVPYLKLSFYVQVCNNVQEVHNLVQQQNTI